MYTAGPYIVGYTAFANGTGDFLRPEFMYTLFFFLVPANIILYGINDLYDKDTDSYNRKKEHYEGRADDKNKKVYSYSIGLSFLASLPLWFYFPLFAKLLFALFFLLAIFYSAKPIRLKAKPFVDSLSNILYAFPAFIGIYQITNSGLSPYILIAALCWTTAMHLFSAIPDIEADKHAKLRTTAIILGRWNSLLACVILWFIAAVCATIASSLIAFLLMYPLIPLYIMVNKKAPIEKIYWYFPFINLLVGFLLYLVVVLT
jgi:4-hydroxybenzoate polyprenyltransferase